MFNNCNAEVNGERRLFNALKDKVKVVFDVGCRTDSLFLECAAEVHYFDPVPEFIEELRRQENVNTRAIFNAFGLGARDAVLPYYPRYQSFYDRVKSCGASDAAAAKYLEIRNGADYVRQHQIDQIDFLKIDTEGHELEVLRGFGDELHKVVAVQFEYGGTYLDGEFELDDVLNYLRGYQFTCFMYLNGDAEPVPIEAGARHYQYCNIICTKLPGLLNLSEH